SLAVTGKLAIFHLRFKSVVDLLLRPARDPARSGHVRVSGPLVGAQTFGKKADGAAVERAAIFNVLGRQFPQGNRQIIARSPVLPRLLNCGMEVMRRWDELGEKRLDMISKDTQP